MKTMKLANRVALLLIVIITIGCSSDSINDSALEESVDQTELNNRGLENVDGEEGPHNPPPEESVEVLVIYPDHYTSNQRRQFFNQMSRKYYIFQRSLPTNTSGSCANVVKWVVHEAQYDSYMSTVWPPPPTDGAGGQPVTKKQDTDDDEDQPVDPNNPGSGGSDWRWNCF